MFKNDNCSKDIKLFENEFILLFDKLSVSNSFKLINSCGIKFILFVLKFNSFNFINCEIKIGIPSI